MDDLRCETSIHDLHLRLSFSYKARAKAVNPRVNPLGRSLFEGAWTTTEQAFLWESSKCR